MKYDFFSNKRLVRIDLGEECLVSMWGKTPRHCKLIQPTPKGYNFLDLATNKCILTPHIYPYKKINVLGFYLHNAILILSLPKELKTNTA